MHYVLQEKICNTLKYVNTRKEMQVLEEQGVDGIIFTGGRKEAFYRR